MFPAIGNVVDNVPLEVTADNDTPTVWPFAPVKMSDLTAIVFVELAGIVKIPVVELKVIRPADTEAASVNLTAPSNR
jgi:hypothetical protein